MRTKNFFYLKNRIGSVFVRIVKLVRHIGSVYRFSQVIKFYQVVSHLSCIFQNRARTKNPANAYIRRTVESGDKRDNQTTRVFRSKCVFESFLPVTKFQILDLWFAVNKRLQRGENINENLNEGSGEARDDISGLTRYPCNAAVKIFSYLSIIDLHRCAQVCRSWKMLTNSNVLWSRVSVDLKNQEKKRKNIIKFFFLQLDLYPVRDM